MPYRPGCLLRSAACLLDACLPQALDPFALPKGVGLKAEQLMALTARERSAFVPRSVAQATFNGDGGRGAPPTPTTASAKHPARCQAAAAATHVQHLKHGTCLTAARAYLSLEQRGAVHACMDGMQPAAASCTAPPASAGALLSSLSPPTPGQGGDPSAAGPSTPNTSQLAPGGLAALGRDVAPSGRRKVLVRFLGDSSYAWMWKDELLDFDKYQAAKTGARARMIGCMHAGSILDACMQDSAPHA